MLKIIQARFQQCMNCELPDVQAGLRKGRGTRNQIANIHWIIKKAREFQEIIYFYFTDYAKAFDCVGHNKLENSERDGNNQTTLTASWEICMQVKKQQLELDMEQQTGSKLRKEYYCHCAYLTYMQSISCKMPACVKHKLESRLQEKYKKNSDMQMTPPLWQKKKRI